MPFSVDPVRGGYEASYPYGPRLPRRSVVSTRAPPRRVADSAPALNATLFSKFHPRSRVRNGAAPITTVVDLCASSTTGAAAPAIQATGISHASFRRISTLPQKPVSACGDPMELRRVTAITACQACLPGTPGSQGPATRPEAAAYASLSPNKYDWDGPRLLRGSVPPDVPRVTSATCDAVAVASSRRPAHVIRDAVYRNHLARS